MVISEKINKIRKLKDFNYLLDEKQDESRIKKYYNSNKIAYLLFHNISGCLHMGISKDKKNRKSDLFEQANIIKKEIQKSDALKVLELGYGRGANLFFLAKIFRTKKFVGVDLSTEPLKRYRLNNINFIKGDYNNLSGLEKDFDIVYAVETICHSESLSKTLREVSSIMKTGAKLIIFDGYYISNFDNLDEISKEACRLVERGMAVDHFHELKFLKKESEELGFMIIKEINYSDNILPSLYKFEKLTKLYFKIPILFKLINYLFPEMFTRNALAAYLMPNLIESKIAGYYMHILEKKI